MKIISKTLIIAVFAIMGIALVSCEKEMDTLTPELGVENELKPTQVVNDDGLLEARSGMYYSFEVIGSPFGVNYQGRPNKSFYKFYVANPTSNIKKVEVIFTAPLGGTYGGFWMTKNSRGNFFLKKKLGQEGKYFVKYKLYYSTGTHKFLYPNSGYVINSNIPPMEDKYIYKENGDIGEYDKWNFYQKWCTSYVAWRVNQMWGTETDFNNFMFGDSQEDKLSDAGKWYKRLTKSNKYLGDNNPQAGDIMCWKPPYGHVAFVHKVENGRVYYSDYNYHKDHTYHSNNPTIAAAKAIANFVHVKDQQ